MGRRVEQLPENYNREAFRAWNARSRANLGVERIDLVQLHCPPDEVYEDDAVFDALDELVEEGHIRAYGVSVETCAQALRAIARPHVASVQIILNCFRLKPLEQVLPAAREAGVGIIARVPLASGLLSGRYDEHTTFAPEDHRSYNRHGEAFDVGETFAGVPYETGLAAARELKQLLDPGTTLAQFALRWVIDQPGVSTVIPGARNVEQVRQNVAAAALAPLRPRPARGRRGGLRPADPRARPRALVAATAQAVERLLEHALALEEVDHRVARAQPAAVAQSGAQHRRVDPEVARLPIGDAGAPQRIRDRVEASRATAPGARAARPSAPPRRARKRAPRRSGAASRRPPRARPAAARRATRAQRASSGSATGCGRRGSATPPPNANRCRRIAKPVA